MPQTKMAGKSKFTKEYPEPLLLSHPAEECKPKQRGCTIAILKVDAAVHISLVDRLSIVNAVLRGLKFANVPQRRNAIA